MYSIKDRFAGSTVFLTGATGYIGGLVLEKLLRTTGVKRIYVLLRNKRQDGPTRLHKLFQSNPVFHLVRDDAALLSIVTPIAGDALQPELGLSERDRDILHEEVDTIIHCAADIRLEAPIHDTLRTNFEGSRRVLDLACCVQNLKSFVHVSTAYANINQPNHATIKEHIYPLFFGDQHVDGIRLAQELLSLPAWDAEARAKALLHQFNFPNTYTLGKHLTEYLVRDYHHRCGLPVAVVRPALVSAIARDPYPGYCGNYAGHVGATLAFIVGFFNRTNACGWKGGNIIDAIPADIVANIILATAAAVGAGGVTRELLSDHTFTPSPPSVGSSTATISAYSALDAASLATSPAASSAAPSDTHLSEGGKLSVDLRKLTLGGADAHGLQRVLTARPAASLSPCQSDLGCLSDSCSDRFSPSTSIGTTLELRLPKQVALAATSAAGTLSCISSSTAAASMRITAGGTTRASAAAAPTAAALAVEELSEQMLILHAGSSTTYPVTIMESWNLGLMAVSVSPLAYRLTLGLPKPLTADYVPDAIKLAACNRRTRRKVWVVTKALRLYGQPQIACKVKVGFAAFLITNSPAVDRNHKFSSTNLRRLADALHPAEREEYMLVWEPRTAAASTISSLLNPDQVCKAMPTTTTTTTISSSSSIMRCREEQLQHMRSVPCNWTTFTLNMGAYLYKSLFGMDVKTEAKLTDKAVRKSLGIRKGREVVLQHYFREYK